MKNIILIFLALIGVTQAQTLSYKGAQQELNSLPANPRIVAYDISSLEIMHALGGHIVGAPVSILAAPLDVLKEDPTVMNLGNIKTPDLELVKAAKPDLIIISGRQGGSKDALSAIAPVLDLSLNNKDQLASLYQNMKTIGQVLNKSAEAERLSQELAVKVSGFQEKAKKYNKADALMLMYVNNRYVVYPANSRFGFVHDVLGFKECAIPEDPTAGSNALSAEEILATNPAYIFIFERAKMDKEIAPAVEKETLDALKATNAYKNNKLIYLSANRWYLVGSGPYSTVKMSEEIFEQLL